MVVKQIHDIYIENANKIAPCKVLGRADKPNPKIMSEYLQSINIKPQEAVMIGDRMDTDVISGLESGMSTVLVLSGVTTNETLQTYAYRPTIVLNGVGDIVRIATEDKYRM